MKFVRILVAGLAALALAGCKPSQSTYQGWIEADTIFIGPDDTGPVPRASSSIRRRPTTTATAPHSRISRARSRSRA